jgi:hypothetical protein
MTTWFQVWGVEYGQTEKFFLMELPYREVAEDAVAEFQKAGGTQMEIIEVVHDDARLPI